MPGELATSANRNNLYTESTDIDRKSVSVCAAAAATALLHTSVNCWKDGRGSLSADALNYPACICECCGRSTHTAAAMGLAYIHICTRRCTNMAGRIYMYINISGKIWGYMCTPPPCTHACAPDLSRSRPVCMYTRFAAIRLIGKIWVGSAGERKRGGRRCPMPTVERMQAVFSSLKIKVDIFFFSFRCSGGVIAMRRLMVG